MFFRIYSKFSQKKMQELSESGLMNFLLLFLVVARRVELEDVASRACELLGFLPPNCSPGHRTLVWRGQLSMLLLFQVRSALLSPSFSILISPKPPTLCPVVAPGARPGRGGPGWLAGLLI